MKQFIKLFPNIDPFSLRLRLTVVIGILSILGLGSLSSWTSWRMQQLLIDSTKTTIGEITSRLPREIELYYEMYPLQTAIEKAVNYRTTSNIYIWVRKNSQTVITRSNNSLLSPHINNDLIKIQQLPIKPKIYRTPERSYILCGSQLNIGGNRVGEIMIAQDITRDQSMFIEIVKNIFFITVLIILIMLGIIAYYVNYALQPLRQISQMTEAIKVEDLGRAKLYLNNSPSEVKELSKTLNIMLSRLAQSWEKEREFTSNISHELRTGLTIVRGYLQTVLRRKQNLTQLQKEALETAATEADRTINILQDLLDLVRADSGYLQFNIESLILNDLVNEIGVMAEKNTSREIIIQSEIDNICVLADRNRLKQILLNLIDNAVKYSAENTPVIINLKQIKKQSIIEIIDRGYGIPLPEQSRIFDRFYRLDEARNRAEGTGLGLAIVKTLTEEMGGSIMVYSKINEGSIFTITLPINS